MDMTIRQLSDLVEGSVVSERKFSGGSPSDMGDVLRLILANCADLLRTEELAIVQDSIELKKMVFSYPGVAGVIEVLFDGRQD